MCRGLVVGAHVLTHSVSENLPILLLCYISLKRYIFINIYVKFHCDIFYESWIIQKYRENSRAACFALPIAVAIRITKPEMNFLCSTNADSLISCFLTIVSNADSPMLRYICMYIATCIIKLKNRCININIVACFNIVETFIVVPVSATIPGPLNIHICWNTRQYMHRLLSFMKSALELVCLPIHRCRARYVATCIMNRIFQLIWFEIFYLTSKMIFTIIFPVCLRYRYEIPWMKNASIIII